MRHGFMLSTLLMAVALLSPECGLAGSNDSPSKAASSNHLIGQGLGIDESASELRGLLHRYTADRATILRHYHLPSSTEDRERKERFFKTWLDPLDSLSYDELSRDGRIDYHLLRNHLDYELRELERVAKRDEEIQPLVPFSATIIDLEAARRGFERVDAPKVAGKLADLAKQVEEIRKDVEKGKKADNDVKQVKKSVALRAAGRVDELRRLLRQWHEFYDGYDPLLTWWAKAPYQKADKELDQYAKAIRKHLVGIKEEERDVIIGDPIGREALLSDLAHEMIVYTPEELIAIAERELAWCEDEMKKAARDLGFGDDWKKALEHVKNQYVAPGKQPQLIHDLALEAIKFIDDHSLVTIPELCREIWRMDMMSPEAQRVNPFFTGGEVITVSFPTDTMSHEDKLMSMRGNNIHFSRATVFHEVIPGHHLQQFMVRRYRPERMLFHTPFFIEGWALYWELRFWDLGFPKSPEDRVGMLFWRMHRCARIIFSLKFHLEQMTPEEAIDFLVDRIGHERSNATGEVRRSCNGSYPPLYQCAYMLGGLQLRALHNELVGAGKMTERAFHDAVLKQNAIPIEMVRFSLTNRPLDRDYHLDWKFAGEAPVAEADNKQ
jgi:uncharacterized protein (DUF885 family)